MHALESLVGLALAVKKQYLLDLDY